MTTVVLADDHALVRAGVRTVLGNEHDIAVVGEAADGVEAIEMVNKTRPDVLIVDMMLPRLIGLDVIRQVKKQHPEIHIIALSMQSGEAYVLAALHAGAEAYVLKEASITDIVQAVREVVEGRRYLSPPLSEEALEVYAQKVSGDTLDRYATLTTREREILHLVAQGLTTAAIADRLKLSPRTVDVHRARFMHKLGLHSQTELVRYAIGRGLIPLPE